MDIRMRKVKLWHWPIRTLINLTPGVVMKQLDGELIRACVAIFIWDSIESDPLTNGNQQVEKYISDIFDIEQVQQ